MIAYSRVSESVKFIVREQCEAMSDLAPLDHGDCCYLEGKYNNLKLLHEFLCQTSQDRNYSQYVSTSKDKSKFAKQ